MQTDLWLHEHMYLREFNLVSTSSLFFFPPLFYIYHHLAPIQCFSAATCCSLHVKRLLHPAGSLFDHRCCGFVSPSATASDVEPEHHTHSVRVPFPPNAQVGKWCNIPTSERRCKLSHWVTCVALIHRTSRLWMSQRLFWCMLSSRLKKVHICLRLGFLRFYGFQM